MIVTVQQPLAECTTIYTIVYCLTFTMCNAHLPVQWQYTKPVQGQWAEKR